VQSDWSNGFNSIPDPTLSLNGTAAYDVLNMASDVRQTLLGGRPAVQRDALRADGRAAQVDTIKPRVESAYDFSA